MQAVVARLQKGISTLTNLSARGRSFRRRSSPSRIHPLQHKLWIFSRLGLSLVTVLFAAGSVLNSTSCTPHQRVAVSLALFSSIALLFLAPAGPDELGGRWFGRLNLFGKRSIRSSGSQQKP